MFTSLEVWEFRGFEGFLVLGFSGSGNPLLEMRVRANHAKGARSGTPLGAFKEPRYWINV